MPFPPMLVGVTVTLPPGEHTITAEYLGTSRWAASSATAVFRVSQTVVVNASLNVSNTTLFYDPNGGFGSSAFGTIIQAGNPRVFEFVAKVHF